jgi:hypothetical protein
VEVVGRRDDERVGALGKDPYIVEPLPGPERAELLGVGAHAGVPSPDGPRGGHELDGWRRRRGAGRS